MSGDVSSGEVCKGLGVTLTKLEEWRGKGLPCRKVKGKFRYDPFQVREWLLASGHAVVDEVNTDEEDDDTSAVYKTRKEVATIFGVNTRTVAGWLEDPSFPGRAGDSRARGGNFPARAIARWLRATGKQASIPPELAEDISQPASSTAKDRILNLRGDKAELELRRMQGELIPLSDVVSFLERVQSYAKTVLTELPYRIAARLPSETEDRLRTIVHTETERTIDEVLDELSRKIDEDPDAE